MAIVRRSRHRWWVSLVTLAGALLATADASASEMGANGRAVACGITGSGCETRSPEGLVLDSRCADAIAVCFTADGCAAARLSDGDQLETASGRVGLHRLADGARSDARLTLRVGRRPRLRIDAEDWDDRIDEDDDSDVPVRVWLRDMVRCLHDLIVPECNSRFPFIKAPSAPSHLSQHLRC